MHNTPLYSSTESYHKTPVSPLLCVGEYLRTCEIRDFLWDGDSVWGNTSLEVFFGEQHPLLVFSRVYKSQDFVSFFTDEC